MLAGALAAGFAQSASAATPRTLQSWSAYEARLSARLADAGGGAFDAAAASRLLDLSNSARGTFGAGALTLDEALARTARAHAADLAQRAYVEHLSLEGFDPTDRLGLVARRTLGSTSENIAFHSGGARADSERLMATWRASPAHWGNLLRSRYRQAGFGVVRTADRVYAVGLYAQLDGQLPADLPFRVDQAAVVETLIGQMPDPPRSWLEDQVEPPPSGDRIVRLRLRRLGAPREDSIYGPIFVLGGSGASRQPAAVVG